MIDLIVFTCIDLCNMPSAKLIYRSLSPHTPLFPSPPTHLASSIPILPFYLLSEKGRNPERVNKAWDDKLRQDQASSLGKANKLWDRIPQNKLKH